MVARGVPWDAAWAMEPEEVDAYLDAHERVASSIAEERHHHLAGLIAQALGRR